MNLRTVALCISLATVPLALGCEDQKRPTVVTSSTGQSAYAARYPEELGASRAKIDAAEAKNHEVTQKFGNYPDEVKDPTSCSHYATVVDLADQAGTSSAYVDRLQETQGTAAFFKDEKDEISRQVAGAANYAAKQKGCEGADPGGAASHALDKSVEKQLQKRLRERNEAQLYIEDNQEALGKQNLDKLRDQVDDISLASYQAKVEVPQTRERMQDLVNEASEVKSTLDRTIKESQEIQADPKRSDADKAAAKKRADSAEAAKNKLDAEVQQAQQAIKDLEQREKKIKDEYNQALDALKKKIDEKCKAQPEKPAEKPAAKPAA
jgi:chromosome segregation ATPase